MKHFDLHALIQAAKDYESPMEFYLECDVTKEEYSYFVMEAIWFYAQNPSIEALLDLFCGSVAEISSFYHIPLAVVEKWKNREEIVEEYILELLLSDMLADATDAFFHGAEESACEENVISEEYLRGYSYYA